MIKLLRAELEEAIHEGSDATLRFELGPVELETSVQLTTQAEGGAGLRLWVLDGNAKRSTADAHTQRVKIVLTPAGGGTVLVGDRPEADEQ